MADLMQQARALLARAYDEIGEPICADMIRSGRHEHRAAIRAIAAALRAAPEGFGSLSPVDHVRYWAEAYGPQATEPHFQGHGVAAGLLAEYADLLERLAARPQGVKHGR